MFLMNQHQDLDLDHVPVKKKLENLENHLKKVGNLEDKNIWTLLSIRSNFIIADRQVSTSHEEIQDFRKGKNVTLCRSSDATQAPYPEIV